jgi:putative endonuclease
VGFTQQKGSEAEDRACRHLQAQGLTLVQRNYRVARGPFRRGGEIDLIMRAPDGTLVFVEVRARAQARQGGAGATALPLRCGGGGRSGAALVASGIRCDRLT